MLHRKNLSREKEVWYCAEENKSIERDEIAAHCLIEDFRRDLVQPAKSLSTITLLPRKRQIFYGNELN